MNWRPLALLALLGAAPVPPEVEFGMPSRELGKAQGRCRVNEPGPALLINVTGLRDRQGLLRTELYPANDDDFLQSDKVLVRAGKLFHRVETPLPPSGPVQVCIRVPEPGRYAVSVLHDRDSNRRFGFFSDGVGFSGNPVLARSKPSAASVAIAIGPGVTQTRIVLNYRRGFGMGPLPEQAPPR